MANANTGKQSRELLSDRGALVKFSLANGEAATVPNGKMWHVSIMARGFSSNSYGLPVRDSNGSEFASVGDRNVTGELDQRLPEGCEIGSGTDMGNLIVGYEVDI